ncbi:magnesium transporter CorA family protein [Dubosiella newyorkensis]|uniref:magnesium transporter CorA family protein n=1 Tax=Dubosiella newyorkensis TaxID=1862672 RepID=UPI003F66858F
MNPVLAGFSFVLVKKDSFRSNRLYNKGMITFYRNGEHGEIIKSEKKEEASWVDVVHASREELEQLQAEYSIEPTFLEAAMDEQESAHLEQEQDQLLLIMDLCKEQTEANQKIPKWTTFPFTLIVVPHRLITISQEANPFLEEMKKRRGIKLEEPIHFYLVLLKLVILKYQEYLRTIASTSNEISERLYKKMNNEGLRQLMKLDQSLVYFSSSLQANQNVVEKIQEMDLANDQKVLETTLVECRQASKMSNLYISINERISEGCNNILSNSMNIVVQRLTVITIILSIPAIVFGFYGMNVKSLSLPHPWIPIALALIASLACWIYFKLSERYK